LIAGLLARWGWGWVGGGVRRAYLKDPAMILGKKSPPDLDEDHEVIIREVRRLD
jgi:hypothetical protein